MKDIDFDELDRAVSSLLGKPQTKQPTAQSPPSAENTLAPQTSPEPQRPSQPPVQERAEPSASRQNTTFPITPASPSSVQGAPARPTTSPSNPNANTRQNAPSSAAQPSSASSQAPERPLASRRAGRFMDVVHPSAAAQDRTVKPESSSGSTVSTSPSKVSRVGRDIQSPTVATPESLPSEQKEPSQPKATTFTPPKADIPPVSAPPKNAVQEPARKQPLQDKQNSGPLLADHTTSHPETPIGRKSAEEVSSPFLTDAKVKKRPLGGLGGEKRATEPQPISAPAIQTAALNAKKEITNSPQDQPRNDIQKPASTLPPELKEDIVAVESSDTENEAATRPDTPPALPPEKKAGVKSARAASEAAASNAAMSIPQQYRAKQPASDTAPRSIYDTDEYHKPLSSPQQKKKKTHPVVWVLLVILLLAVGAGLGVAAYFLLG